jgi:hypothetical protein
MLFARRLTDLIVGTVLLSAADRISGYRSEGGGRARRSSGRFH